jgi:DNA-binding IclR family transcriptional regulator
MSLVRGVTHRSTADDERPEVGVLRERGYALTTGELVPGTQGIAAPIRQNGGWANAAIGVAIIGGIEQGKVGPLVVDPAVAISDELTVRW